MAGQLTLIGHNNDNKKLRSKPPLDDGGFFMRQVKYRWPKKYARLEHPMCIVWQFVLQKWLAQFIVPRMGRHKKPASRKMSARIPFVMGVAQKQSYEWAAGITESGSVSEWLRNLADAEVARLRDEKIKHHHKKT